LTKKTESMSTIGSSHYGAKPKLAAKKTAKPINFICQAPAASEVSIVGDFNEWKPGAHPMDRKPDGSWQSMVSLGHGHHRYAFVVDGAVSLDPKASGIARNDRNERVSLIAVS